MDIEQIYRRHVPKEKQSVLETIKKMADEACPLGGTVLDFGCSAKPVFAFLRSKAAKYIGVDIDPTIPDNCAIFDEFFCVNLCDENQVLPLQDRSVDLVVSNMVFEHLPRAGNVFRELIRVIKPGGLALISVPNVAYPVFTLNKILSAARLDRLKLFLLRRLCRRRAGTVFSAYYRLSLPRHFSSHLKKLSSEGQPISWEMDFFFGGCYYFRFWRPLFLLSLWYEKCVYHFGLKHLLPFILITITKESPGGPPSQR